MLARASAEFVIADIKSEIAGGSEVLQPTADQAAIYRPSSPQMAVPYRVLALSAMATSATFNNLVKQSTAAFFPSAGYARSPSIAGSTSRTTDVSSANNRSVSIARWNIPTLNTGSGFTASNQLPQWILLNRQGIATSQTWINTFRDYTPGNDQAVVGRFAFNVYDVGGLLDANVAGYPVFSTALTAGQRQQLKSTQTGASLFDSVNNAAIIPGFDTSTKQQTFVNDNSSSNGGWKFATAGTSSSTNFFIDFIRYPNTATSTLATSFADSGFLRPTTSRTSSQSNTVAFSRHDLLRLTQTSPTNDLTAPYLTTAALPYFTHFSRELNAPSWYPQQNASGIGGSDGSGTPKPYAYFDNRDNTLAANRFIPNVRVLNAFRRSDGTLAAVGDPLVKSRFPLRRIDAVGYNGVDTTAQPVLMPSPTPPATPVAAGLYAPSAGSVQRDFGLVWNSSNSFDLHWDYVGPTGNTVQTTLKTLNQVASESPGREPNFFELLKAVILSGSIGLGSTGNTFLAADAKYSNADYQIIQIGANIIDAWDADNIPTFIKFGVNEVAGIENLPYLSKLVFDFWVSSHGAQGDGTHDQWWSWLVPSFWNPHQNAASAPALQDVRFVMTSGSVTGEIVLDDNSSHPSTPIASTGSAPYIQLKANAFATARPAIPAPAYSPVPSNERGNPLHSSGITATIPDGITTLGVYDGIGTATSVQTSKQAYKNIKKAYPIFAANTVFQMQVLNASNQWQAYQTWNSCSNGAPIPAPGSPTIYNTMYSRGNNDYKDVGFQDPEFVSVDPRTVRFGVWGSQAFDNKANGNANYYAGAEDTMDQQTTSVGAMGLEGVAPAMRPPAAAFPMTVAAGTTYLQGFLYAANNQLGNAYSDLDGVQRSSDSPSSSMDGISNLKTVMYGSASPPPIAIASPTPRAMDRPANLSRQIRTVAELGTVFRDQPWKTLNFTTPNSGDAGLLDVFAIFEPNSVSRSDVIAGKLSLNTRQVQVIKAVLDAVATITNNNTPLITTAQRDAIATALVTMTSAQPMINKSELATRLAVDPSVTTLGNKEARDAVIRALADVGQTRTWNLMIDVVAQSGQFKTTASTVDDFIVQGEKRYWLHVAIDRFTGEIIDQQLEAVYE